MTKEALTSKMKSLTVVGLVVIGSFYFFIFMIIILCFVTIKNMMVPPKKWLIYCWLQLKFAHSLNPRSQIREIFGLDLGFKSGSLRFGIWDLKMKKNEKKSRIREGTKSLDGNRICDSSGGWKFSPLIQIPDPRSEGKKSQPKSVTHIWYVILWYIIPSFT